jgi:hypothetical protein
MTIRFDYYVVDEYGDIWNKDPLPTFGQAKSFENYIKPLFNRVSLLFIKCVERGEMPYEVTSSPMHDNFWKLYHMNLDNES